MMKKYFILIALALTAFYGCQKGDEPTEQGSGKISIACAESDDVTAAQPASRAITAPAGTEFRLTMTGVSVTFSQSWAKVSAFDPEVYYAAGNYKAVVDWGNIDEEGVDKPYFKGEKEFTVVSRKTTNVAIEAKIANSLVKIECTDKFRSYFTNATFTLTTAAAHSFTFYNNFVSDNTKPDTTVPVFIKPATYSIVGSAYKQAPASSIEAPKVDFPRQDFAAAMPQKQYIIQFDCSEAGSAKINILIDDTVVETRDIDIELNDDAQ